MQNAAFQCWDGRVFYFLLLLLRAELLFLRVLMPLT